MKPLSKKEEQALLRQLSDSHSYFSETFSSNDVEQMIGNIENDYTLLMFTTIQRRLDELEQKDLDKTNLIKELEAANEKLAMANKKLNDIMGFALNCGEKFDGLIYDYFELNDIVEYKIKADIKLNNTDRCYLHELLAAKK